MLKTIVVRVPRRKYIPGDEVKGKVFLEIDEHIKCKKAYFGVTGLLTHRYLEVKVKGKGRVSSSTKEKTWSVYSVQSVFAENMEIKPGIHEFNFQFQLPDDLLPSYNTSTVSLEYVIGAIMEISRFSKLQTGTKIDILKPITEHPIEPIDAANHDITNKSAIRIKLDSQKHSIGEEIVFEYYINTEMKFKTLRLEIEHCEHFTRKITRIISKAEIPSERVIRYKWVKFVFPTKSKLPVSLDYGKFKSSLNLKATIVRKLNIDITARIPLTTGHDLIPGWREELESKNARRPGGGMTPRSISKIVATTDKPLSKEESIAHTWYNRSIAFRDEGEIVEAIRSVEKALEFHPENAHALALRDELKGS